MNEYIPPAPKRIIICCDGTWQSSVTNTANIPSNVTRIARYLNKTGKDDQEREWQQVVYYDAGIGTGVSGIEAKRQGGTGAGFVGNVIEAYNFIVLNYNEGDKIYCFGFSRGAYTARAVAGLVTDIGIVSPRDMQDFPHLYQLYQAHTDSHGFRKSKAWREWVNGKTVYKPDDKRAKEYKYSPFAWEKRPHGAAAESTRWVEAIGVFDTVGSLGIPEVEGITGSLLRGAGWMFPSAEEKVGEKFGFHNVALSPFIKHAYHAMALDERRKPFNTTLWHLPADGVATTPKPKAPQQELRQRFDELTYKVGVKDQELDEAWNDLIAAEMYDELHPFEEKERRDSESRLLQVWFPGYHINVGGGSDDLLKKKESDFEQMATITLNWMIDQMKDHLSFHIKATDLTSMDRFQLMRTVVDDLLKTPRNTWKAKNSHWLLRRLDARLAGQPTKEPWEIQNIAEDILKDWGTGDLIDTFNDMKKAGEAYRTPGEYKESKLQDGTKVKLGATNERMHPVVQYRLTHVPDWKPVPLKDFKRQKKVEDGVVSYEWVKGGVKIPEYKIREDYWAQRGTVTSDTAVKFLGRLDKDYGIESYFATEAESTA